MCVYVCVYASYLQQDEDGRHIEGLKEVGEEGRCAPFKHPVAEELHDPADDLCVCVCMYIYER
jgi:hypothetical protein